MSPRHRALGVLHAIGNVRRAATLAALAVAVMSIAILAAPRGAFGAVDTFDAGSEGLLLALQNDVRATAGSTGLREDPELRRVARWRSEDMAGRHFFSHTVAGTTRNVFWYLQHAYGYCFTLAGENIGTVTWPGASEDEATRWVFGQFMASEGHRENILGASWDSVGVGAYRSAGDTYTWTVVFAHACSAGSGDTGR